MDKDNNKLSAGVDEVGRGPLAGPVVAGAVILDKHNPISGLRDSKQLTEKKREEFYSIITEHALAWSIGRAEVFEIDHINILQATFVAMQRAVAGLKIQPDHLLIDGHQAPYFACTVETIVKGDQKIPAISAASIIAKVSRDREMIQLDDVYPEYGFAKHKGYGTKYHLEAIANHGVTPIHRRSFAPVRNKLAELKLYEVE